jgi:hypothetical protein
VAPVRSLKWRLVLFFVVETVAIAAMIALFRASRRPACNIFLGTCATPSFEGLFLGIASMVGELAILAAALKMERPAWAAMLGLGLSSLFIAMMLFLSLGIMFVTAPYSEILLAWHGAAAILLCGAGLIGVARVGILRLIRVVEERRRERGAVA